MVAVGSGVAGGAVGDGCPPPVHPEALHCVPAGAVPEVSPPPLLYPPEVGAGATPAGADGGVVGR